MAGALFVVDGLGVKGGRINRFKVES